VKSANLGDFCEGLLVSWVLSALFLIPSFADFTKTKSK